MQATATPTYHGTKTFNPSDYRTTGLLWPSESKMGEDIWLTMSQAEVQELEDARTEIEAAGRSFFNCAHCGNHLSWVAIVRHEPTGELLPWGCICIERLQIPTEAAFRELMSERGRKSWAERGERIRRMHDFATAKPWVAAFIALGTGRFWANMRDGIRLYGSLTERQAEAIARNMAEAATGTGHYAPRQPKVEPTTPLVEGRRVIEGEVVSTKYVEGYAYGSETLKMLVVQDDGNKVWGTVPGAIEYDVPRGKRVRFTATVERSRDDQHFGFFKRPTKAEILTVDEVAS